MLKWLLGNPRDDQFYRIFEKLSDYGAACAKVFSGVFDGSAEAKERIKTVEEYEHRGDALIDEMYALLNRTFITAIDKSDIEELADELDDVLDAMKRAAFSLRDASAKNAPPEVERFTDIILQMTQALNELVHAMPHAKSRKKRIEELFKLVNGLESEGDNLFHEAVEMLWQDVDGATLDNLFFKIIRLEKWRPILANLESITDHCDHAAKKILSIIEKGS